MSDPLTRWKRYRPSKGVWFWSCMTCIVATLAIGFGWGGWVTGGEATRLAASAATDARARLAAAVCVSRFENSPDAQKQLAALKKAYSYQRDNLIEENGWATMPGSKEPVVGAAGLCAQRIVDAGLPATNG